MTNSYKAPRFKCTGCGKCCTGNPTSHYVELTSGEAENIRRSLGISHSWFIRRYLVALTDNTHGIRIEQNRQCVFLDKKKGCKIYELRPRQCRSYPFWPEILHSRSAWKEEARRCEGIGQGTLVAKKFRVNL
jgi:Fe-S-cluster containining protein